LLIATLEIKAFATNFNPEINIREITQKADIMRMVRG